MSRSWLSKIDLVMTIGLLSSMASAQNTTVDSSSSTVSTFPSTTLLTSAEATTTALSTASEEGFGPAVTTQDPDATAAATPSASVTPGEPQIHHIKVGAGGHNIEPNTISTAAVGDILAFEFYTGNHSIARAEYKAACMPIEYTDTAKKGFWSGPQPVAPGADTKHWTVTVNSTEPMFFYCAAPGSCKNYQMVGVVNPNNTQTLAVQIEAAKNADYDIAPGEPAPPETSTSSATSSPTASDTAGDGGGLSDSAIGMIVGVCIAALAALIAALGFFIWRSKSWKKRVKKHVKRQEESALAKPVGVEGLEMGHVQFIPQSPQSPYESLRGQSDFGSQLPPYASPRPHTVHIDVKSGGFGSTTRQQSSNDLKGHPAIAELHSPMQGRQERTIELEAPNEPTQEKKV